MEVWGIGGHDAASCPPILPEFRGVAQLDVGEALLPVVFQGALVDEGIAREFIAGGAVAPVAVAHHDVFGIRGYGLNVDELVKSRNLVFFVIPVKTGIQYLQYVT